MRIDPKVVTPITSGEPREPEPRAPAAPPAAASVVDISTAAAAAAQATESTDPRVTARIAQIKSLLQAGAYPVDLDKLASRILDDEVLRGGPA